MTNEFLIRPGDTEEIERYHQIDEATQRQFAEAGHPEFVGSGVIPEGIARRAIAAGRILVADVDGEVVGWVFLTRSERELCIGQIAIDPSYQRRGIGTSLIETVIANARRNDERSIVLSTQSDVAWNRPWYERLGFEVVPPHEWTDDMAVIVEEQRKMGLDWDSRVHRRLVLTDQ